MQLMFAVHVRMGFVRINQERPKRMEATPQLGGKEMLNSVSTGPAEGGRRLYSSSSSAVT